ncbi:hypothetical protein AMS68_003125 [Peltaster fructicola]|uniref:Uncharacterized protein n=1 Tax=Peltaster fructicola TaxID=286661 RepID=A0A6H0XSL0_9PEZI|nr:hypothetical protein AMS68_003125 [Peltaster fructicola]
MRLGRFKHHRRLFEAFDALGLTYQEVQDFCCWEGSRWARLKYEEDQGEKVIDTTGDGIGPWVDRRHEKAENRRHSITRKTDISVVFEEAVNPTQMYRQPRDPSEEVVLCPRLLRRFNESIEQLWLQGVPLSPEVEAEFKEGVERAADSSGKLLSITKIYIMIQHAAFFQSSHERNIRHDSPCSNPAAYACTAASVSLSTHLV